MPFRIRLTVHFHNESLSTEFYTTNAHLTALLRMYQHEFNVGVEVERVD